MKTTKKGTAYTSIKNALKKLGLSTEDTTGVINYVKFIESNTIQTPSVAVKTPTVSTLKGHYLDNIVSVLSNNPKEMYDVERISKESGVSVKTVRTYIKQLRTSRKVKVVGCDMTGKGPAKLLYQAYKSPLKAIKTVTQKQGFDSAHGFFRNNKKLMGKSVTPSAFAYVVEQAGLTMYPLLLGVGIVKGYRNTDLKKLAKETYSTSKETVKPTKRKYTKKVNKVEVTKPKRKYTKKVKQEVVPATPEVITKKPSWISIFKKKNNVSELIKF